MLCRLGGGGGYVNGGYPASQAAVVQKHIYVHVPPPEHEEPPPQRAIPVQQAQKHYKIIFIKGKFLRRFFPFRPFNCHRHHTNLTEFL